MVLESTMVCVDSSDYMRNGDFVPTRLQAQQDAVNLVCHAKTRSNPENNVGLVTLTNIEVLAALTTDVGRLLAKLHQVHPDGNTSFISGIRVAHLALKHRQGKNHKMRIIVFVGSPIQEDEKELIKLAKRLKKEKVNVDIVNFGEDSLNTEKLTTFVNTVNGKDGTGSHLVTVSSGPMLSDALVSSPIVAGEDGSGAMPSGMSGFEFGVDPNEDPELALALRVSMEEQRSRQEEEAQKVAAQSAAEAATPMVTDDTAEETMLKQALEMSQPESAEPPVERDFSSMTEEEQIAYAMQLSMQPGAADDGDTATPMETDDAEKKENSEQKPKPKTEPTNAPDEDYSEVFDDPEFLQSVLEGLPGVDPQNEAIQTAMGQLAKKDTSTTGGGSSSSSQKDEKKKEDKK